MKKIEKGAKVSVLDEDISGVVKSVKGKSIIIETTDGFELTFAKNEVVKTEGFSNKELTENIENNIVKDDFKKIQKKNLKTTKKGIAPPMEVDLHIEQLINNHKSLSNFQILNIQVDTAKYKLDFAIRKRIQKVIFIHGVGQGVLKAELEYLIKRYEGLSFKDADFYKYGQGAIEVYIPQSAFS